MRPLEWARTRRSAERMPRGPGAGTCGLITAAGWSLFVLACSPQASTPQPKRTGFIAVVGAGGDDPLWPVLRGSALRQQALVGDLPIRAEAPRISSSHAQAQLIRRLRDEGMRGLCIQVIDPAAIAPHLSRLAGEGTVVVTMIHPVQTEHALMHCGVDQAAMGKALAQSAAETLNERGTLAVLHANSQAGYALERYRAFREHIKLHAGVHVLREFDCGGNVQRAQRMMRQCMERFPRLNAWVTIDNWPLRDLDPDAPLLPASCRLVTTDPQPDVWDHLASGTCAAMIAADYDRIAREAVLTCATALEGRMVRWRTFLAEPRPVRPSGLHQYKIEWFEWCSRQP